jgi:hypothetical protein
MKFSRSGASFSRPSSSTGSQGIASSSASAKSPRPSRAVGAPVRYTLTRSIPQLGESFLST